MNKTEKIWAIVPAAGIGARMGGELPKQYLPINGKPILAHTLEVLCELSDFANIIVPLHPEDTYWSTHMSVTDPRLITVEGGALRFESVMNALEYIKAQAAKDDWVLVHDAVRPCVSAAGIKALLAQISADPVGGLWGVPVRDTLKKVDVSGKVLHTVAREDLWHALTPQIFRFELLYRALQQARLDNIALTDEASAIEHLGYHPQMVQGSYANIKITWPEDLITAALWFNEQKGV